MKLLDTNIISEIMLENASIEALISNLSPTETLGITTIVRGEILYGIERLPDGKRKADLRAKAQVVLARFPC